MDTDAVNHWKRYVGADTAMERGKRVWRWFGAQCYCCTES